MNGEATAPSPTRPPAASRFVAFSPSRVWTLATATVTQLVRMKILVFLLVFAAVVVAAGFVFPVMNPEQQLKLLKDVSFGALQIFAIVIAIVSTALLLPRDLEDRTLYTILSKPVPRVEYLIGKLLGVLLLIGGGLFVMDAVLSAVLWMRQNMVLDAAIHSLEHENKATPENIAAQTAAVAKQGLTWALHAGVLAIFLKAAVVSALALLISCFASTTLFTIVTTFCLAIVGHGQQMLREYFFHGFSAVGEKAASSALAIICPDLGVFDIVENIIKGAQPSGADLLHMTFMALLYVVGYVAVAHLVFVEKEL
ncbi:MAG: ABC transporter permease subunit [Verrucomicrobiaceae bacterium]|nr:ABC transporter permease subunit [Verrucomicrobiaceae bacterium]